jgi:hypothetical protein
MDEGLVNRTFQNWKDHPRSEVVERYRVCQTRLRKQEAMELPEMVREKEKSLIEGHRRVLESKGMTAAQIQALANADLTLVQMAGSPPIKGEDGVNTTLIAGSAFWVSPQQLQHDTVTAQWQAQAGGPPCQGSAILFQNDRVLVVVPDGDELALAADWNSEAFDQDVGWNDVLGGACIVVLVYRHEAESRFAITV